VLSASLSLHVRAQATPAQSCVVAGTISAGRVPLPGVVVSLTTADNQPADITSSGSDGTYALKAPGPGQFHLKAELVAFAPIVRDVTIDQAACQPRIDLTMTLASRAAAATPSPSAGQAAASPETPASAAPRAGLRSGASSTNAGGGRGQGRGTRQAPQQFQSLTLMADDSALARGDDTSGDAAVQSLLPPGFSPDSSSESVTSIGTVAAGDQFFGPGGFGERFGGPGDGVPGADGPGGFGRGGPGGPGGFGGGRGLAGIGPGGFGGRGRGANQIRGSAYQSFDASALDTGPVSLNGQPTTKPQYFQQRFGATLGGPIGIPKVFDSARTFFFLNYTGNHSRNPYDTYSTVPSDAERNGDLTALGGSVIPSSQIDPAAKALLSLFPEPNQTNALKNLHTISTTTSNIDDVNVRLVHMFGAVPQRGQRGFGGGARGGGRAGVSNLNIGIHYRHSATTSQNPFATLGGESTISAWDIPVGYSFSKASLFHSIRAQFNRNRAETQNLFAFNRNVAGDAGIAGISSDPFDWGAPSVSIAGFQGLRDISPSMRTDQTMSIGDTIVKSHAAHTIRFGGDFRDIRADSRSDPNARGSFVFTGLYTGVALGDFLLGLPQQSTFQSGQVDQFHQHTGDLFIQDDWRARASLTVNAGLRWEYYSPVSEADNRLATLDAPSTFTAAVPVAAGGVSPFSGLLPTSIVRPDYGAFAPRVGLAWKATPTTTVRTGYGINYSASVYQSIAQQLANQPPFDVTTTVLSTPATPAPLESVLTSSSSSATTNTYGVDPNYRLGYVQIWNADVQHDIARIYNVSAAYTGTKGANLDLLRAPNRTPTGLLIPGVPPFIWESSGADSIMNALTLRFRRRLTNGIGTSASYTFSKSIDDASSIGGSGSVVAQNDQNLAAERGLSSFDQRHRFTGDFTYELPFGAKKRWFTSGMAAELLGDWQINGNVQLASGTPFTATVLASISDVSRGTNGTLRGNYNGQPITIADPTALEFFNTAVFSIPAVGTFGTAGRNTIIGPGTSMLNAGLTRNITLGPTRSLSVQILANNILNTVQFASIDTIVNSPTFGQVTTARPMRRVQILTRLRF
jgi:trimeric autotransporter adhesin